ncbi:DUF72 domain-containing protein [Rhodococcus sp. BP-316]|nr:DUF72 domain-containing protein [Rhodococcus sp. BP-316]
MSAGAGSTLRIGPRRGEINSIYANGSLYSLQRATSYARWRDEITDGILFAVNWPRFIVHMTKLRDVDAALGNICGPGVLARAPPRTDFVAAPGRGHVCCRQHGVLLGEVPRNMVTGARRPGCAP